MKRKVINTRVTNDLYDLISEKAKARGVTVSNLIRNLVEDSLEISGEVFTIVDQKIKQRFAPSTIDILAYQPVTLAKDAECDLCGKVIKKETPAYFAFTSKGQEKILICGESKKELESTESKKANGK